mmetsp:Transcript_39427/g.111754  ORF Transcript_39427/g.111754 Transcript_39427/m.111754 type:complete len:427 (-) Transcript_39427:291-1571(-)
MQSCSLIRKNMNRPGHCTAAVCFVLCLCVLASADDSLPKKKPTAEMEEYCRQTVKETCGILPSTNDYVYFPKAAAQVDATMICSDACQFAIEGVNCKGTEYEDLKGEYGPDGYECQALRCFNAIQEPCDITPERTSTSDAPIASCTSLCVASLSSTECDRASELPEAVHEECAWDYCKREIEASCGALDFLGGFGIDLADDVHPWLFARLEQLCSPVCTSTWDSLMDTSHKAQCWKFDNLQEARNYLDDIVCECYQPVQQGCGNILELDQASMDAMTLRNPQCCQALNNIPCRMSSANDITYDDYSSYYGDYSSYDYEAWDEGEREESSSDGDAEPTPVATAGANSEGRNSTEIKANLASSSLPQEFDIGDKVALRISLIHQQCFPMDSFADRSHTSSAVPAHSPTSVAAAVLFMAAALAAAMPVL